MSDDTIGDRDPFMPAGLVSDPDFSAIRERNLWAEAVVAGLRAGKGYSAIHDANDVLAEWRRQFAPTRPGEGEGVKP